MSVVDIPFALDIARRAAAAASAASLPHFERGVTVERKADRSPVTAADRAAEQAILSVITEAFPDHSIVAEESGVHVQNPRCRWIIDPIDGTRGFTRGGRFWGSLIALEVDQEIVVGTLALPALDDIYYAARGQGCFYNDSPVRIADPGPSLDGATLSVGEMRPMLRDPWGPVVRALIAETESARCYGDLMGVALVLQGVADVWIEAGVAPWDIAPMPILVEEAGGVFSTFAGDRDLTLGTAIAGSRSLHAAVLSRFRD